MFCNPDSKHLWEGFHYALHALPVDKWEVLLSYHPPSSYSACATCSPQSSVVVLLGGPMTHSPEISTQTFSDGKILEINSFASTVAMSAAVASLSTQQFTRCAGDILSSNRWLSACP
jgi:hypothetical protein